MQVEWYGQSAFRLTGGGSTVFIDPFGDVSALGARGLQFEYPPIEGVAAELLLVTHEHLDHNGVELIGGSPHVLRSTAGRLQALWVVPGVPQRYSARTPATRTPLAPNIFC